MLRWIVKDVESPYGNVSTYHWAVPDTDATESRPTASPKSSHFPRARNAAESNQSDADSDDSLQRELESAEDQLGAVLWNSNSVALRHLHAQLPTVRGRRVVELGAGVGCLGIALAIAGARVAVTDLKELVPLMRRNIRANAEKIRRGGGSCAAVPWRWGPPAGAKKRQKVGKEANVSAAASSLAEVQKAVGGERIDFVLLCDALYGNPRDWPHLLFTLTEMLAVNPQCEVINFCEQRVEDVEGAFLALLESENARVASDDAMDSMESVMRRRRGRYKWHSETKVVAEGDSELDMAVRVTRICWKLCGKRMREAEEEEEEEKGKVTASDSIKNYKTSSERKPNK